MVRTKKTVKMGKGEKRKVIEFEYDRAQTEVECKPAFDQAVREGKLSDKLSYTDVVMYGLELKIRAKIQGANGDEGQKVHNRKRTIAWVMTADEGSEFRMELATLLGSGDTKGLNEYLDDLYEAEKVSIDDWRPTAS